MVALSCSRRCTGGRNRGRIAMVGRDLRSMGDQNTQTLFDVYQHQIKQKKNQSNYSKKNKMILFV